MQSESDVIAKSDLFCLQETDLVSGRTLLETILTFKLLYYFSLNINDNKKSCQRLHTVVTNGSFKIDVTCFYATPAPSLSSLVLFNILSIVRRRK